MKSIIVILTVIVGIINCSAQSNLDFEKWDVNYNGIDEAKSWINTSNATEHNAPSTLFKLVESPASGLASLKLTTAYWAEGSAYNLDTLVGSLFQQVSYSDRPKSFEFTYKSFPKNGDEVLIGVQLTATINDSFIVVGEGYFTSNQTQNLWTKKEVAIEYCSNNTPDNINLIALSSANAVITTGKNGYAKIGSTLFLDDLKLRTPKQTISNSEYYIHVFPNPAKEYINITTNATENQQIEIYNLNGQLLISDRFAQKSKIDISKFASGTYIYKVFSSLTGEIKATNKFNVVR